MTTRIRAAGLTLAGALLLSACAGQVTGSGAAAPTSAAPSTTAVPPMDAGGPTAEPTPEWNTTVEHQAADLAVAATNAWVRKGISYEVWWADASRYFIPGAAQDYALTDPDNVPGTQVTAPPTVIARGSAYLADVDQPTDAGTYRLVISRDPESDLPNPWLVVSITPPAA